MIEFDSNKNHQLSALFFGGELEEIVVEPCINQDGSPYLYKTGQKKGQIKLQKVRKKIKIKGLELKPLPEWKTLKEGVYQTNEQVLKNIQEIVNPYSETYVAADLLLKIRGLRKEISTYYESVEVLIYPDGCVHAKFNHTQTETGRLSSSNPNVQNVPS